MHWMLMKQRTTPDLRTIPKAVTRPLRGQLRSPDSHRSASRIPSVSQEDSKTSYLSPYLQTGLPHPPQCSPAPPSPASSPAAYSPLLLPEWPPPPQPPSKISSGRRSPPPSPPPPSSFATIRICTHIITQCADRLLKRRISM